MTTHARTTKIAATALLVCLVSTAFALHHLDRIQTQTTSEDVLYLSSPKVLKRLSLGYDGLLADLYWTRAIQYFGTKHYQHARDYKLLAPLLEITTTLDPHLIVAYEFGANFLAPPPPFGSGMPQRAIRLVEYGIRNNPDDWKLYYNLGFIDYMELKDYAQAADAFARGAKVPNAHPALKVMAAEMAQHAGDSQMAQIMWTTAFQSAKDPYIRANAITHLRALQVDQDISSLETLISVYRQKTGHPPSSFTDLQEIGLLRALPLDPFGHAYKLTPGGRVELRDPDNFPFITKGTPPGYVAPPVRFRPEDLGAS